MKQIIINGVEFTNFGANNYSEGMELITSYPCYDGMVQDVLNGRFPGVYLNPSAPCTEEFFGVFGTENQYKKFYQKQVGAQIAKKVVDKFGCEIENLEEAKRFKKLLIRNYKDWWAENNQ